MAIDLGEIGLTCLDCGREAGHDGACRDYVSAQDFDAAAAILKECSVGTLPVGQQWLGHAFEHLVRKLDRYFRDRPKLTTEQMALAEIRRIGLTLKDCAHELAKAARRLKEKGDSQAADLFFKSALRFEGEAKSLTGEE